MIPRIDERNKRILEFIEAKSKDRILVIGTGVFPKIEYFLFHRFACRDIVSGDINKKNIINGKKLLPEIKFLVLDAQKKFLFKDETFDKVILTEVLEHLKNEDFALNEINRVLKKNGKLILSVPKSRWFSIFNPITWIQHEREYNKKRITKVLKRNNFKILDIFVGGDIYEFFSLWIHLILKHFFHILHIEPFFKKQVEDSYKKNSGASGFDIIVRAEK